MLFFHISSNLTNENVEIVKLDFVIEVQTSTPPYMCVWMSMIILSFYLSKRTSHNLKKKNYKYIFDQKVINT